MSMIAGSTFVPTPGLDGLIATMAEVEVVCETAAEQGVAAAKSIAPVLTGAYAASIVPMTGDGPGAGYGSSIRYAGYLEYGTSVTPTFATLRRSMDAIHI